MKVGVLGTGIVGRTLAGKLVSLAHQVTMGSRQRGNEMAVAWASAAGESAGEGSFADAAHAGELVVTPRRALPRSTRSPWRAPTTWPARC